jgi:hypothetical protein
MANPFNVSKLEKQIKDGMTKVFIDKDGDALKASMDKLIDKMYKTMTTTRHKARGSEKVGAFSQYGVPVDTGRLKSSIKKLPTVSKGGHIIGGIIQDASIAPYGASVEYGHGIKRNGQYVGWVPPQSFMRSTRELYKTKIKDLIKKG